MLEVKHKFSVAALYRQQVPTLRGFLSDRWSFWLALFSCIAFLVGNMVGQHGFRAFWKSVWGREQISFEGTVMPIAMIPDPERWSGDRDRFEFSDVPESLLVPLPPYRVTTNCEAGSNPDHRVYSVAYLGDYEHAGEGCGSHPAVDILTPRGTPVLTIANGIVDRIEERNWGYGNTIVIMHPDVPHPDDPTKRTTLYSGYAHLGRILVQRGEIVRKGQQVALSGQTGFATTAHLHFQVDRESAPFHPYWPFTTADATKEGLSFVEAVNRGLGRAEGRQYTVHPLAYVQAHLDGSQTTMIASEEREEIPTPPPPLTWKEKTRLRREQQLAGRIVRNKERKVVVQATRLAAASSLAPRSSAEPSEVGNPNPSPHPSPVSSITLLHDGSFDSRDFEQIVLFVRDAQGNFLQAVQFDDTLTLGTAFGSAEFSPPSITAEDFDDHGRAFVKMLPRGQKTVIPTVSGFVEAKGEPMVFAERQEVSAASARLRRSGSPDRVSTTLGE